MSKMNHPDTDQLTAYVRNPTAGDGRQISLHLAACVDCRQQVGLLSALQANLPAIEAARYQAALAHNDDLHATLQTQSIEKFVDAQLGPAEQQRVEKLLAADAHALKAALHYAGHSARMQRELGGDVGHRAEVDSTSSKDTVRSTSGVLALLRRCLDIRTPVWLTIPVGVALAGLLTVVLVPRLAQDSGRPGIIAYQDNPVIEFKRTQDLPGIGFFSAANKVIKPYDKLIARLAGENDIQLAWPRVDNAVSYTMQLKVFINGQMVSVGRLTTTGTQAGFKRVANDAGRRYTWGLSGKTADGVLFSTKGGFIINAGND